MNILQTIFITPWSSVFFVGNMFDYMALLLPASLAAAFAFRAGLCNLGLEGQIYAGGFMAGVFLIQMQRYDFFSTPLLFTAALIAMFTGALLAAFCAFLKKVTGTNELITSFLLSAGITPVVNYFITGPLRDTSGNLLATRPFGRYFMLDRLLPPSSLSVSFFIALILPLFAFVFFNKTVSGYRFRLAGDSPDFARYGGIDAEHYWIPAFSFSGALGGLSGFFGVAGTYGMLHQNWTGGLGWAGIAVALIARGDPLVIIPAAFFYAYLKSGTDTALLVSGAAFESSALIQAVVLFFVTARRIFSIGKAGI